MSISFRVSCLDSMTDIVNGFVIICRMRFLLMIELGGFRFVGLNSWVEWMILNQSGSQSIQGYRELRIAVAPMTMGLRLNRASFESRALCLRRAAQ
jgi:hypothetical protein